MHDAGVFAKKVPSLAILQQGSPLIEVDQRIEPLPGEKVSEKKYASSFFGTSLDIDLRLLGVDTVILAGCTTSGCIRASAIDSLQYGFHTIVVREAVGDRAAGPHEANLFDIDAKYGDVVDLADALDYLRSFAGSRRFRRQGPGRFRSLVAARPTGMSASRWLARSAPQFRRHSTICWRRAKSASTTLSGRTVNGAPAAVRARRLRAAGQRPAGCCRHRRPRSIRIRPPCAG